MLRLRKRQLRGGDFLYLHGGDIAIREEGVGRVVRGRGCHATEVVEDADFIGKGHIGGGCRACYRGGFLLVRAVVSVPLIG